ncbi:OsmC family protein [Streptomyces sp. NPDC088923]|uniref:OsmC family protein n=1 Tax=Streptomyces sp. NPDC088923 TaxID=3365913 RepID=UPI00382EF974
MRNGLNITGVSETVHEIRESPAEAVADFAVSAPDVASPPGTVTSRTLTARNGTVRMARDFRLTHRLALAPDTPAAPGALAPTPYEAALASLGACVLVTTVNGCTARGITLGGISVTVRAELPLAADGTPAPGRPLEDIGWRCEIDCEAPTDVLRSVSRLVTAFSPNHRAFLDAAPLTPPLTPGPATAPGDGSCSIEAVVVWEYGSEAVCRTTLTVGGVRHTAAPFGVDQAKQMLGIDKAPNSQEVLLAALSAELSGLLPEVPPGALLAAGRIDTQGMLNIVREVPSSFHRLRLSTTGVPESALPGAVTRAVLPATLSTARPIVVELWHNGVRALRHTSTSEDAEAVRDELTNAS